MTRLILKIIEEPIHQEISEEELTFEGRREIINDAQDMIKRLEEMDSDTK